MIINKLFIICALTFSRLQYSWVFHMFWNYLFFNNERKSTKMGCPPFFKFWSLLFTSVSANLVLKFLKINFIIVSNTFVEISSDSPYSIIVLFIFFLSPDNKLSFNYLFTISTDNILFFRDLFVMEIRLKSFLIPSSNIKTSAMLAFSGSNLPKTVLCILF